MNSKNIRNAPVNQAPKLGFFNFKRYAFQKLFLKSVSSLLVITFTTSQLLYAADVRQMLIDAKNSFLEEDAKRATLSSGELIEAEASQQSAVDVQNEIADIAQNHFSLTTQNGDILDYVGSTLKKVTRLDGSVLQNISMGANGLITNADLRLSDGSVQVFDNGNVIGYQTPDGTQVIYQNGQIQKTIKDGIETLYSYNKDAQGNLIETVLENSQNKTTYDAQGKLKEVFKKALSQRIVYQAGILQSIVHADGSKIIFKSEVIGGQTKVSFQVYLDANGNAYKDATQVVMADGSLLKDIVWDNLNKANNAVLQSIDGNTYSFIDKNISSVRLVSGSTLQNITWDNQNNLKDALLTDVSGNQFNYVSGAISSILLPDASRLQNIAWDNQAKLQNAILTDAQNNQWTIQNIISTRIQLSSGAVISNITWDAQNNLKDYTYTDTLNNVFTVVAAVVTGITLSDGTTLKNITWDATGKIQNTILTDTKGNQLTLAGGVISSVKLPDGSTATGMTWNATGVPQNFLMTDPQNNKFNYIAGALSTITLADNSVLSGISWDSQGKLQNAVWISTQNNKFNFVNGTVASINLAGGSTLTSIVWDAAGNFNDGILTDAQNNQCTFANKLITQIKLADNSVITNISWDAQGKVQNALFTDPQNNQYTFTAGVITQIKLADNSILTNITWTAAGAISNALLTDAQNNQFTFVSGAITQVKLSDASVLTGITWAADNKINNAILTQADGSKYTYVNKTLTQSASPANVITDYAYTTDKITATTQSVKYEYLLDMILNKITQSNGAYTLFNTTGLYKGLKSQDLTAAGVLSAIYEYQTNVGVVTCQQRSILSAAQAVTNGTTITVSDKNNAFQPASPVIKADLKLTSTASTSTVEITANQTKIGNITRTLTAIYQSGKWTLTRSDLDSTTNKTTVTTSTVTQALSASTAYTTELRFEGTKANLYVYATGVTRPTTPTGAMDAFAATTKLTAVLKNATLTSYQIQNNLQTPAISTLGGPALTTRVNTIKNLTLTKKTLSITKKTIAITKPVVTVTKPQISVTKKDITFTKPSFSISKPVLTFKNKVLTLAKPAFAISRKILNVSKLDVGALKDIPFESIFYDANGNFSEIRQKDGNILYFEQGLLKEAKDLQGNLVNFDSSKSDLGNLLGTSMLQNGLLSKYDTQGNLSEITLGDMTIRYQGSNIDSITKEDGTEIRNITFDAQGNIKDCLIITPDGQQRTYRDKHLVRLVEVDDASFDYVFDQALQKDILSKLTTNTDLVYNFDYQPGKIEANLDSSFIPQDDFITRMEFDAALNLQKTIKHNNEIVEYLSGGKISKIISPSGSPRVFGYAQDGSYTVTQDSTLSFYDKNNTLLKVIITDSDKSLEVVYGYGRIREIYRIKGTPNDPSFRWDDKNLIFKYTYEANKTLIQDLEEKSLKTYENELLLTSFDQENSVLSTYEYSSVIPAKAGIQTVTKVVVTRFNRVLHTYDYSYDVDKTIVVDEENVKRTYDANKKLLFLEKDNEKYAYAYYPQAGGTEIVEETLIEKTQSDGTKAIYEAGSIKEICLTDGSKLSDIILESQGFKSARVTDAQGIISVITNEGITQQILLDGTHLYYQSGRLNKIESPSLGTLEYSYDLSTSGSISNIWVKKQGTDLLLKYDAVGNLLGLKLPGILTPTEIEQGATHNYAGGANGGYSHDNNLNSAQTNALGWLYSEHLFTEAQNLEGVTYKFTASSNSNSNTNNGSEAKSYVEVKDATTGLWSQVPGTYLGQSHNNGGGGSTTAIASTPDTVNKLINIKNIIGVRGVTQATAYQNGSGNTGGYSAIWEIQYQLADQSFMNYLNNAFIGPRATFNYDAQGKLLNATQSFQVIAKTLENKLSSFTKIPKADKLNISIPQAYVSWMQNIQKLALDPSLVALKEYSSAGILEAQAKADGSITLFENNKPSKVLDQDGKVLMEYSYDADGNPSKVYLKHAREVLPVEMDNAKLSVEQNRQSSLLALAKQKNLAYQSIESQANTQKEILKIYISDINAQKESINKIEAKGKQARSQKADALNSIDEALGDITNSLSQVYQSEADAYEGLDAQIKNISDQIQTDFQNAHTQLVAQEANLKNEILKQEMSPIIYDYYRRILGRDPSSQEYSDWIAKIDYETGKIVVGENITEELKPGASASFDGSGDMLQIADSEDWNFGNSNFTIDISVKLNSLAHQVLYCQGSDGTNYSYISTQNGNLYFYAFSGNALVMSVVASNVVNTTDWAQIAVQRNGSNLEIYVNGQKKATAVTSATFPNYTGPATLGALFTTAQNFGNYLSGYIDGFRISKGIARYSQNFTPQTVQCESDSYTKLLINAKDGVFKDDSSLNYSVQKFGDAKADTSKYKLQEKIVIKTPILKELTAELKNILNTSLELTDRTNYVQNIKGRIKDKINAYLLKSNTDKQSFAQSLGLSQADLIDLSSSDTQKILKWIDTRSLHFGQSAFLSLESLLDQKGIAYAREDIAERSILIDILTGVISPLDDGDLVISMFALNKVAALYGADLASANLSWDDLKKLYDSNKAIITEEQEVITTPGASTRFNGSNASLKLDSSPDWTIGTGDFTVDGWINLKTLGKENSIFSHGTYGSSYSWFLSVNSANKLVFSVGPGNWASGASYSATSFTFNANAWHHIAVQRQGNNFSLYVDGKLATGYSTAISNFSTTDNPLLVGASIYPGSYNFDGAIDGLRISKGVARYNANFTPSSQKTIADASTKLLLYADASDGIKDRSLAPHAITVQGATLDTVAYAQFTQVTKTKKVITRYPSIIKDPSKLTEAQKQDIIDHPENYNPRVIAHISGNHYVIITDITDTTITYIDPGVGKDKQNESVTVTREGFSKAWRGDVSLDKNILISSVQDPSSKLISASNSQSIRGAGLGSILGFVGSIVSFIPGLNFIGLFITAISAVVSAIEGDFISAISSIVTLGFANFGGLGTFFSNTFKGFSNALGSLGTVFGAIGGFVTTVFNSVTGFLGNIASGIGGFLHGALGVSSKIAADISRSVVSIGVNFAVSKGLDTLGVSPELAGFVGSLASGAMFGAMKGNTQDFVKGHVVLTSIQQNIQAGVMQTITLSNVGRLGMELGLDSSFTNIIGLSLSAIQGNVITNPGATLAQAFSNIKPQLLSSLSQYGIERLGSSLGIDSRITNLIGTPISSVIGANYQPGVNAGTTAINAINDGILRGVTSLGIEYATRDLDPIIAALSSRAISGALQGVLSENHNIFNGVINSYIESFENFVRFDNLLELNDFSSLISQKGLVAALEERMTGILGRDSVESIVASAGSMAAYIQKMNAEHKIKATVIDDISALQIPMNADGSSYIVVAEDQSQLLARKNGNTYEEGEFAYNAKGEMTLKNGLQVVTAEDGSVAYNQKENGYYTQIHTVSSQGKDIIVTPRQGQPLSLVQRGNDIGVINGVLEDLNTGVKLTYTNSQIVERESISGSLRVTFDELTGSLLETPYMTVTREVYDKDLGSLRAYEQYSQKIDSIVFGASNQLTFQDVSTNLQMPSFGGGYDFIFTPGMVGEVMAPGIMVMPKSGVGSASYVKLAANGSSGNTGFVQKVKDWANGVINWFNFKRPNDPQVIAEKIGSGHGPEKHEAQFPEFKSPKDFIDYIKSLIGSTKKDSQNYKKGNLGREAWWDEKTNTIVIHDPNREDRGTIFRPDQSKYPGRTYFDEKFK